MYTVEMGYKTDALKTAVQYTQEGRRWQVVKTSNSVEETAVKTNKLFVVQTPLATVSITCQELVDLLSGVMDAYDMLVNAACESGVFDAKFFADNILPAEVERFSKPNPAMSFPVTWDALPILMRYMGQMWRYDRTHQYWWPLSSNLDFSACNTPPVFIIDAEHPADSKVEDMSPATLINVVADIINCFTSLGTVNKAGVYNFVMLEG